jgi:hypothetical protein
VGSNPTLSAIFFNGKKKNGLGPKENFLQKFSTQSEDFAKSQYQAKARKSDAPTKVPGLQAHQDQRQVALLSSSDLLQRKGQPPRRCGRRTET